MDLADFRNQIDEIDQELMALFRRRMETVEQIAAYKEQHGLPVYDPQREGGENERPSWRSCPRRCAMTGAPPHLPVHPEQSPPEPPRRHAAPLRPPGPRLAHSYSLPFTLAWALTNTGFFSGNRRELESLSAGRGLGWAECHPFRLQTGCRRLL